MNAQALSTAQSPGAPNTYSAINLRGLGTDETLILVDGRRMPGISLSGERLQPDINGIPLAAVERIEVLPSTAGGIYGGSAVGGVVNVIDTRIPRRQPNNVVGVDALAGYGTAADGRLLNGALA